MTDQITVTLGAHEVPVYPQPWPYLLNSIAKLQGRLAGSVGGMGGASPSNLDGAIALVGDNLYDVLVTAVPSLKKRMPRYEFAGFSSQEAMDLGEFDEDAAKQAPTIPQIKTAFKVAAEVNGVDVVGQVVAFGKVIWGQLDPEWRQDLVTALVGEATKKTMAPGVLAQSNSDSTTSASSPSTNGGSPTSTRSGAAPTSTVSTPG